MWSAQILGGPDTDVQRISSSSILNEVYGEFLWFSFLVKHNSLGIGCPNSGGRSLGSQSPAPKTADVSDSSGIDAKVVQGRAPRGPLHPRLVPARIVLPQKRARTQGVAEQGHQIPLQHRVRRLRRLALPARGPASRNTSSVLQYRRPRAPDAARGQGGARPAALEASLLPRLLPRLLPLRPVLPRLAAQLVRDLRHARSGRSVRRRPAPDARTPAATEARLNATASHMRPVPYHIRRRRAQPINGVAEVPHFHPVLPPWHRGRVVEPAVAESPGEHSARCIQRFFFFFSRRWAWHAPKTTVVRALRHGAGVRLLSARDRNLLLLLMALQLCALLTLALLQPL